MRIVRGRLRVAILVSVLSAVLIGPEPPVIASTASMSSARDSVADAQARPDAISAKLAAKTEGRRIEITGDDTATSTTYANPDGTLTTEQSAGPIRVLNADRSWSPLDLTLTQGSDGSWSPGAVPASVEFSGGGDKSLAIVSNPDGVSFGLGWASKLPAPTVAGGTATYQVDRTTSLVVASTALGFTTHVVLSTAPKSAPKFRMVLELKRLAASQASDGSLIISDTTSGKAAWRSPPFVMWDSQTDDAGNPTNVQQVSYTVSNNNSGHKELDLSPAMAFLNDPSTQYPVTIDPDLASATPIGDTYVYTNALGGNTTPEWTDYQLPVGSLGSAYTSYVNFDTSAFAGKHVLSAALKIFQYFAPTCTAKPISFYPAKSAPTSSTVYANRPDYDASSDYSASASFNHGFVLGCAAATQSIDVSKMAQGWAAGTVPSNGIAMVQSSTNATYYKDFCSLNPSSSSTSCKTASTEPVLSYTYKSYPGVPISLGVSPGTLDGSDVYQVPTLTPTLAATPVQPDGGTVTVDVEVDSRPSGGVVYSHAVSGTAGSPASVQVPSGLLHQGDQLTWKARTEDGTDVSAWSDPQAFTLALPPPPVPTVNCIAYPQNIFTNRPVQPGDACTISDADPNLIGLSYGFDSSTNLTSTSSGNATQTVSIPTSLANDSWHTLFVEAVNPSGTSSLVSYNFGIGIQCRADGSCIPGIPTALSISPGTIDTNGVWQAPSRTPSLTATAIESNPNGDAVYLIFTVVYTSPWPPYEQSVTWNTTVRATPGAPTTVQIPSGLLNAGSSYTWQSYTWDTTQNLASGSSSPQQFLITAHTVSPTASCPNYPQGAWSNRSVQTGDQCVLSDTDPELAGFFYSFDAPPGGEVVMQVAANPNNQQATIAIPSSLAPGWHTLYFDAYNNQHVTNGNGGESNLVAYNFGIGIGGLSSPLDGQRTQRAVVISTASEPSKAMETLNYRLGTSGTWVPVPTGDVTINSSGAHPSAWPHTGGNGAYPDMTWDVASTVTAAGGGDGPVQLQACFRGNNTTADPDGCSSTTLIVLDRTSFTAARETDNVGPGSFAPATGDFMLGATDVGIAEPYGSLSVGRSLTTLAPALGTTGASGVLGPAWRLQIPGPDFTGASQLTPAGSPAAGLLTLTDEIGTTYTYKGDPTQTTYPFTYTGVGDSADGSVLTQTSATTATLADADGTKTDWTQTNGVWQITDVTQPGKDGETTYTFDSRGRVSQVIAPALGLAGCDTDPRPGCRVLVFHYAAATTATSDVSSGWEDYLNQLSAITYTAYDPQSAGMKTTTVAQYAYDTHGLLRAEWDPRISPAPKTTYSYDANNRLVTLTPPGLNPWTMSYDSAGRLVSVSRSDPANGTATQAIAYGVPLSGSGAPVNLSPATTAAWGETSDLPYGTGTAIFPADHVPATGSGGDYAPTSSDWPDAALTYRDANGRQVNTADFGAGAWLIGTSEYDSSGNVIMSLSPGNRAQALSPTSDTDPAAAAMASSAARANALATLSSYTDDGAADGQGVDLTDIYSPISPMVLDNGATVDARRHTHYSYDEGEEFYYPTLYHLVTTTTTGAYYDDGSGAPTDHNLRTTLTGYHNINNNNTGWEFRAPTTQTIVMPGTREIETKTSLDFFGNVIASVMPKADGGGGYTTLTDYYSAGSDGAHSDCGNHPEWAGFVCWTGPAAQPDGQTVPTTELTYNYLGEPTITTQNSGSVTRTNTSTYDDAGRPLASSISDTTPGVTQVPTVSIGYDPATGLPTTTSTASQTITTDYDALGRPTSYTVPAAAGTNTTTASYDIDGRTTSVKDGKGTTTYTYASTDSLGRAEHRGLLTGESAGDLYPSTFAAAYDADGNMVSESYPANVVATREYDNTGSLTALSYAVGGTTLAQFSQSVNAFGEIRTQSSPESSQTFSYDAAARLAQVADTGDGTCVTRAYSFDLDTNRAGLSTYPANGSGACSTATTPTTQNWTHDTADRATNTGYTYDPMGRTLAMPGADTSIGGNGNVTLTYFANDMVHTENDGTNTDTFILDPAARVFSTSASATGLTTTDVYSGPGDLPAWLAGSDGSWTRNITDIAGDLAAIHTHYHQTEAPRPDTTALQIVNPHGDVVATLTDPSSGATTMTGYFESTEFGVARAANTVKPDHYGWLGGKRRDSGDLAGLVMMGRRLYDPYVGRFSTTDPVPGGSANNYDYCGQDPVNNIDLAGTNELAAGGGSVPHHHHHRAKAVWKRTTPVMQIQDTYDVISPWKNGNEKEAGDDPCPGCDVVLELAFNHRKQTREAVGFQENTWTECNQYHECRSEYSMTRTVYEEQRTLVFFYPKWQWRVLGNSDLNYEVVSQHGGQWHSKPWRV